jgi:thiamine phosphate phosphatase / amino-HMP aminohydrolase
MPPRMQIVMDWDSTLTTHDTTPVIASIGYKNAARNEGANPKPWSWVEDAYLRDLKAHEDAYDPKPEHRGTIKEESAWLASLKYVERRSFQRLKDEDLFEGLSKDDMEKGGMKGLRDGTVVLRPGWQEVLAMAIPRQKGAEALATVAIVSVGWSETFIRGCLLEAASKLSDIETDAITFRIRRMSIYANEIVEAGSRLPLHTSADKKLVLSGMDESGIHPIRVYVGDSVTDFDALLGADIGICIRDYPEMSESQAELASTLSRLSIKVHALEDLHRIWNQQDQNVGSLRSSIWWTSNIRDVGQLRSLIS